ncbi:MAG: hypothetical protein JNM27_21125 [Leptospirales bacterium]|nr:hypothetical protein [Leptospirales bacterium]
MSNNNHEDELRRRVQRSEWRSWAALILSMFAVVVSLYVYYESGEVEPRKQGYQDAE